MCVNALLALHQISCRIAPCKLNLLAFARLWASGIWFDAELLGLTIVRLRMVFASPIVERDTVGITWVVPQVHVAIGVVISIGLVVACAAEPPRGTIFCSPCLLTTVA
jgi:hypothetical protein